MSYPISLRRLAQDFINGKSLPARIGNQPLSAWLDSLANDQRECHFTDLAVSLGVTTERPWIGEVAAALKFRLEEAAAIAGGLALSADGPG